MLDLPILAMHPEDGEQALFVHELTDDEHHLFTLMDSSCVLLPEDAELEVFHERVIAIGQMYGLDRRQSIALWTRTTFCLFER